jgi:hypothetical protein
MQLFDPDSCAIVRTILEKVQSKIYSAALAAPSSPSSGNFVDGTAGVAFGNKEAIAAAEARAIAVQAELEREREVVECLRAAAAAAAQELQSVQEQARKDREDLDTMLANESLLSRALDEKKRECSQLAEDMKRLLGADKAQGIVESAESDRAVEALKEELAAARLAEANAVREQLAAAAAAASAEAARAEAAESLMSLKAEHAYVCRISRFVSASNHLLNFSQFAVAAARAPGADFRQRREAGACTCATAGNRVLLIVFHKNLTLIPGCRFLFATIRFISTVHYGRLGRL